MFIALIVTKLNHLQHGKSVEVVIAMPGKYLHFCIIHKQLFTMFNVDRGIYDRITTIEE